MPDRGQVDTDKDIEMRTYNPAADTYHCEQAIGALDDSITALNRAMERLQLAARHSGGADRLADEYLDRLIEVRDELTHQRRELDEELSYVMELA